MEHIDRLTEIEPHIFNGGNSGFYSCEAAIREAMESYPSAGYEITGADCSVFADVSFPFVFESLISGIFRSGQTIEKLIFHISLFEENGFPKCRIDIIFPGLSIPEDLADWIINNESRHFTNNPAHMAFFVSQNIIGRYSGNFSLAEHTGDRAVFAVTLYQESDPLKNSAD
ncbi:MAG: hypothetical protein FWE78_03470 [Methanimicrococcus sp.]|nr:hypothetical protein [Methanimicrococcus sp.]